MSKLRNSARGRNCEIRIPYACNNNPETVVLCHLPGGGMGGKRDDLFGAFGCSACHDIVDGRLSGDFDPRDLRQWFYEGVFRTQQIWLEEGLIRT